MITPGVPPLLLPASCCWWLDVDLDDFRGEWFDARGETPPLPCLLSEADGLGFSFDFRRSREEVREGVRDGVRSCDELRSCEGFREWRPSV